MDVNETVAEIHEWNKKQSFWDDDLQAQRGLAVAGKLMEVVCHLAQSCEAFRHSFHDGVVPEAYYSALQDAYDDLHDFEPDEEINNPERLDYLTSLGKLMLVTTELAEIAEAIDHGDHFDLAEELADTVIRLFDLAGHYNINLADAITSKMAVNRLRPFKHGKVF